jgi:hypothetical protein
MFVRAINCNQTIVGWCTSRIKYMDRIFDYAHSLNQDIGKWNNHRVKYTYEMFQDTEIFNQSLIWNTRHIKHCS